jgi:hypothetical protein
VSGHSPALKLERGRACRRRAGSETHVVGMGGGDSCPREHRSAAAQRARVPDRAALREDGTRSA